MASVDPSELLSHASWLRQLAGSLVHEGADDLVQDTWVAALRRPPRDVRGARAWLRAVVTNAARLRWRGDANRRARENATAEILDHEAPSPAELLERHELQQLLARLVTELDEPFRSTVLLRFAEGLTPTQIARRLSIPAGTVRWRLKEALARLRAKLDALHRGDRRTWMLVLAPLAMPRHTAPAPIPLALLVLLGAAVCVVAIVVVLNRGESRPSSVPQTAPRGSVAPVRAPSSVATAELSWFAQEGVPHRVLQGRVVLADGAPAAGALVRLIAAPLATQEIRTDANGHFDFGEQPPREYALGASMVKKLAAIQHVDLRDPAFSTVELVLGECAAGLYGKVTDASGTPIPGAQLLREGVVGAETDVGGNYELCTLPTAALFAEVRLVVRAHGFGTIILPLAPNGQMHRDFVLAPEASITGRLLDVDGAPMLGARVTVDLAAPEGSASRERGVSISALTGDDGTFRLAGLSAGEYLVAASSASAVANAVTVDLEAAETRDIELRASPTGVLRGRVVARGLPVGGVSVAAGDETAVSQNDGAFVLARVPVGDVELKTAPYRRTSGVVRIVAGDRNTAEVTVEPLGVIRGTVRRHGRAVPFARVDVVGPSSAGVTADASGRYEADGLEAGTYGFYSDDRRRGAMTVEDRAIELGPGETREHDIELAWGGAISGRVVDKDGVPVVGATVGFRGGMSTSCLSDASGVFACGNLRGGKYSASVHPASGASYPFRFVEPPTEIELRDGDARVDGVRLVVAPAVFAIEGKVVDGAGAPVTDVAVNAFGLDRGSRGKFQIPPNTITNGDGQFRIIGLSPGEYLVEVQRRGLAARERVAAGATNISLLLDRPPCDGAGGHAVPTSLVKPPSPVVWDQKIELVGWSLPTTIKRGESVEVVVVYRTLKSLERDWTIFAHFDSPEIRVNGDHDPGIGWCPTKDWKAGEAVVDRTTVRFDKPDRYALTIGFFTGWAPSWDNLPISVAPAEMNDAKQQGVHLTDVLVTE